MPYHIESIGGVFLVKKDAGGHVMGTHKTKAKAQKQMYALYISENGYRKEDK
jgi:hypothetical protein